MKTILSNVYTVFSRPKYTLLALIFSLLFYSLQVTITSREGIQGVLTFVGRKGLFSYFFILLRDYSQTVTPFAFRVLIVLSILFGCLAALIIYKVSFVTGGNTHKKDSFLATCGIALSLFASSCLACGIGLFSLIGIGTATLALLPYGGGELSVIAIFIMGYALLQFANNLFVCKRVG